MFTIIGIIILIVIGTALLLAEIFFTPGLIVGIIGVILSIIGIAITYHQFGAAAGHYTVLATGIVTAGSIIALFRYNTWNRLALNEKVDSHVNTIDEANIKTGDIGTTISRLAPAGMARINEQIYEVESIGEFINEKTEVTVIKIMKSKIWVKRRVQTNPLR